MNENIRKTLLYFKPIKTYWKSTEGLPNAFANKYRIGHYPQSIAPRIDQGHYSFFDENGIPCLPNNKHKLVHHYTTLCSYALGMWEKYLQTGEEEKKIIVLKVADFLVENNTHINDARLFLDLEDDEDANGIPCAMNQGEAISVLIRAHTLTNNEAYINLALQASKAFANPFDENGVCKIFNSDIVWYQEAGKFILNGHCYAVIGLSELYKYTNEPPIYNLYIQGIKSIESALPFFDAGFWSRYWLDSPEYFASIMYHNLHIVQLEILAKYSESLILSKYAKKFEEYSRNPIYRIQAFLHLAESKIS